MPMPDDSADSIDQQPLPAKHLPDFAPCHAHGRQGADIARFVQQQHGQRGENVEGGHDQE